MGCLTRMWLNNNNFNRGKKMAFCISEIGLSEVTVISEEPLCKFIEVFDFGSLIFHHLGLKLDVA